MPATSARTHDFTFADLFAGIGGMRMAFENAGGACILTSEIDPHARQTYKAQKWKHNLPRHQYVHDVVRLGEMEADEYPADEIDVLLAGFPCQPYSIAGLRQGLHDEKGRGQVFLSMLDILRTSHPKAFMLENVKGLKSHDGGKTVEYMVGELEKCGYTVLEPQVLNSMLHGGVPQNRERVFIIGFRDDVGPVDAIVEGQLPVAIGEKIFTWPKEVTLKKNLVDLLEKKSVPEKYVYTAEKYDCYAEIAEMVTRSDTAYQWRRVYVRENKSGVCPALTANMGSGGHNVPLVKVGRQIRKLTPRECARLQGFPDTFVLPEGMADAHLYHQFGNSVTVPLIQRLAKEIARLI